MCKNLANESLFSGTAQYYARYRDPVSQELPNALSQTCKLDGKGILVDIGTGTGQIAVPLAPFFTRVIAVDPETEMLAEAARITARKGISNITFLHSRAEDLPSVDGEYRLITIGSAFHWMDRKQVLNFAYSALEMGGVFALIEDSHGDRQSLCNTRDSIPRERIRELIRKYLGPHRRAGRGTYFAPQERYEDLLDNSNFGGHSKIVLPGVQVTRDINDIIGFYFSTSFASRSLFGDSVDSFENELRATLKRASPSGKFSDMSHATEVIYAVKSRS